jgi:hypothetical protein
MLYSTKEVRIRIYHMPSFLTTITMKRILRWHHLRCYMVIGVGPLLFWNKAGELKFLDRTYFKKEKDKYIW